MTGNAERVMARSASFQTTASIYGQNVFLFLRKGVSRISVALMVVLLKNYMHLKSVFIVSKEMSFLLKLEKKSICSRLHYLQLILASKLIYGHYYEKIVPFSGLEVRAENYLFVRVRNQNFASQLWQQVESFGRWEFN
ncbi:hypothetical protein CEXT_614401 [Caerostris extrusa]|uniref:Uncharacterized protein n=1 Tax=Caerostris extrusa TaxID=172846 RepID=A0AAV4RRU2_CAEEX|nr:hypothetical protein CEXT_614401 [Caerostris extrusa]